MPKKKVIVHGTWQDWTKFTTQKVKLEVAHNSSKLEEGWTKHVMWNMDGKAKMLIEEFPVT
jgi:hypothetical protein